MRSGALLLAILAQLAINVVLAVKLMGHEDELSMVRAERQVSSPIQRSHAEANDAEVYFDQRFRELREELHSIRNDALRESGALEHRASSNLANQATVFESATQPDDVAAHAENQRAHEETRTALEQVIAARSWTAESARTLLTNIDGLQGPQRVELMQTLVQAVNRQELRFEKSPF